MDLNDAFDRLDQLRRLLTKARAGSDEVEDICQSAFLRWWRTNQRCPGRLPASYIVRLGLYERTSFVRRNRPSGADTIENDELPASVSETSDEVTSHERTTAVRDAVLKLKPRLREVMVLRFFEGLRIHEIAERCGGTTNTVKLRLHRAKHLLREALESYRNN